jgi:hypothetical protein
LRTVIGEALKDAIQLLYISGYTDNEVIRQGVLPARVELLQKPFGGGALARKVREVLDSPRQRDLH